MTDYKLPVGDLVKVIIKIRFSSKNRNTERALENSEKGRNSRRLIFFL